MTMLVNVCECEVHVDGMGWGEGVDGNHTTTSNEMDCVRTGNVLMVEH